jgi:hypothetical protein
MFWLFLWWGKLYRIPWEQKKYYIKSKIEWLSDCESTITNFIQESTLPKFPFKDGNGYAYCCR